MEESTNTARLYIEDTIIYMFSVPDLTAYALVLIDMYKIPSTKTQTIGVTITDKGTLELYYNPLFINSITSKQQLIFILIHEVLHIVLNHHYRTICHSHVPYISNLVQDAIINESIIDSSLLSTHAQPPNINNTVDCITLDTLHNIATANSSVPVNNYKGPLQYEPLYEWLIQYIDTMSINLKLSNFDEAFDAEKVPELIQEQLSDKVATIIKERGTLPSDVEQIISVAKAPKRNSILSIIKNKVQSTLTTSDNIIYKVFTKPHLYGIEGLPGKLKKQYHINCILDTSGSMTNSISEVLKYLVNSFTTVTLIQIDTEIQSITTLKSTKDTKLHNIVIKGYGGTQLQPAIDYIISRPQLRTSGTLILTDGYTDSLNTTKLLNKVLIISTDVECDVMCKHNQVIQKIIKHV